jgi:adenylosuccinate synthase
MQRFALNVLMDGQWGSCGKGLFAGYLAKKHDLDVAITCRGPNSGGWYKDKQQEILHKQLPSSAVNPSTILMLSASSVIDEAILLHEIEENQAQSRLHIHPLAPVITALDKEYEKTELRRIASTMQGTGSASGRKVMRHPDAMVAKDVPSLKKWVRADWQERLWRYLRQGAKILMELPQGYCLSLDYGFYPYCTSRNISTSSALSMCGLPPSALGNVYGIVRTYPIRVGNIPNEKDSYSGPCFDDQNEITWEDVTKASGQKTKIQELTTVTKRVRRVFTFSHEQLADFVVSNDVTHLCVNFMNYLGGQAKISGFLDSIEATLLHRCRKITGKKPVIHILGWGPLAEDLEVFESSADVFAKYPITDNRVKGGEA